MSFHYNGDDSYLFVNGKEIHKFKVDIKNVNFLTQLCLGSISIGFCATESREVCMIFQSITIILINMTY